jgi:C4-type Zn-finger protein
MVEAYIEASDPIEIDTQSMKHISGVLKDIKEVLRSPKDLEEQDARIAKLRKEAEKEENQNRDFTITIEGGDPKRQS